MLTFLESVPREHLIMGAGMVLILLILWGMIKVINSAHNELEWWHLLSTRSADGKQYADWNKIGQGGGVILSMWLPSVYAYSDKMDSTGLAAVMGMSLLYLGGVSGYAATLRSRQPPGAPLPEVPVEPRAIAPAK